MVQTFEASTSVSSQQMAVQQPSSSSTSQPVVPQGQPQYTPPAVNITYDKLFEILRTERNDPNLQKLQPTFFADVRAYLQLKQESISKSKHSSDLFAAEHVETAQQQIRNALRILADIYDRRERKTINLALNKAKAATQSIDTSHLLAEEKSLFAQIVALLSAQRSMTQQLLFSPTPNSATLATSTVASTIAASSEAIEEVAVVIEKKYLVIEEITEFFGPDMQHYGPFAKGDSASFSDQIARILLKKNLIKQV